MLLGVEGLRRPESAQEATRSKLVKINLRGKCKRIELAPDNRIPGRCMVRVELDYDISSMSDVHDIQLFVPTKFGTLLEVGLPVVVTLEQKWNWNEV
jgi:hypothetical protein